MFWDCSSWRARDVGKFVLLNGSISIWKTAHWSGLSVKRDNVGKCIWINVQKMRSWQFVKIQKHWCFETCKTPTLSKSPITSEQYNDFKVSFSRAPTPAGFNDVSIYDLRHTYEGLLIRNGVSLFDGQKLFNHSSPKMTQPYAHLNPNSLKQIVNNLPGFLWNRFTVSPSWQGGS